MLHAILDIFKSSDDWLIIEATGTRGFGILYMTIMVLLFNFNLGVLWGLVEYRA